METGATPVLRREPPPPPHFDGIILVKTPAGKDFPQMILFFNFTLP